jgi:hypothetical protein
MIEDHLLWRPFPDTLLNLRRGVALFLFVLQLTVYRVYGNQDSNVRICIVNTGKAKPAPSYPAHNLLRIYGIKSERKLSHEHYTREYLVHGEMKGCRHFQDCDD